MTKGALLILVNGNNEVLLQHKDAGAPTHPNQWCLFGGGIESGETAQQTIHREFVEELEWEIGDVVRFAKYPGNDAFYAKTNKEAGALRKKLHEGSDLGYFSEQEVTSMDVAEPHLRIIKDYFAGRKPLTILFVCRGNTFRSIIAETYLKSLGLDGVEVISAGTVAAAHKAENKMRYAETCALLKSHGLQKFTKANFAEQLDQEKLNTSDAVICVNRGVFDGCADSFKLPSQVYYWDVADIGEAGRTPKNNQELKQYEEDVFAEIIKEVDAFVALLNK